MADNSDVQRLKEIADLVGKALTFADQTKYYLIAAKLEDSLTCIDECLKMMRG